MEDVSKISRSEADSYANPIPSYRLLSDRKYIYRSCKSKHASCAKSDARVAFFFARMIQQLGFSSQRRLLLCPAPRRVHFLRPWTLDPSLRRLTLVWPRRDVPRRFTWYSFQSIRAQHDVIPTAAAAAAAAAAAVCTLV